MSAAGHGGDHDGNICDGQIGSSTGLAVDGWIYLYALEVHETETGARISARLAAGEIDFSITYTKAAASQHLSPCWADLN